MRRISPALMPPKHALRESQRLISGPHGFHRSTCMARHDLLRIEDTSTCRRWTVLAYRAMKGGLGPSLEYCRLHTGSWAARINACGRVVTFSPSGREHEHARVARSSSAKEVL